MIGRGDDKAAPAIMTSWREFQSSIERRETMTTGRTMGDPKMVDKRNKLQFNFKNIAVRTLLYLCNRNDASVKLKCDGLLCFCLPAR